MKLNTVLASGEIGSVKNATAIRGRASATEGALPDGTDYNTGRASNLKMLKASHSHQLINKFFCYNQPALV